MQIVINYGDEQLTLELPQNLTLDEYKYLKECKKYDNSSFISTVKECENDFFALASADLFVVNDAYRHTPTEKILGWLKETGRINDRAKFIVATGSHELPNAEQFRAIFGSLYDTLKDRITAHNSRDRSSLTKMGEDCDGFPVYVNNHLAEAKRVVIIGSVEPHYFAGFTGGRKAIFPGLCDYETIVRNHARAVSFEASPMKLKGNPVHEHLNSLMNLVLHKDIFSIQIVSIPGGEIAGIFCGRVDDSFSKAKDLASKIFGFTSEKPYDILLAEVRAPLDCNLYQLQKSLENCQGAVRDSGSILLFSPCHEGIGSQSFYALADRWQSGEVPLDPGQDSFGIHKLSRVKKISERVNVFLYSKLKTGVSDKVYFKSMNKPQAIIDDMAKKELKIKAALVRDAGQTVLTVRCNK